MREVSDQNSRIETEPEMNISGGEFIAHVDDRSSRKRENSKESVSKSVRKKVRKVVRKAERAIQVASGLEIIDQNIETYHFPLTTSQKYMLATGVQEFKTFTLNNKMKPEDVVSVSEEIVSDERYDYQAKMTVVFTAMEMLKKREVKAEFIDKLQWLLSRVFSGRYYGNDE